MSDLVEGGNILKQVDIADGDTAVTLNGKCYEAAIRPALVERFELQVGYQFKDIEPDSARRIERFDGLIAQHEAFWVEKLATLQPITVPYADRTVSHLHQQQFTSAKIFIPHEVITFLQERHRDWNQGDFLFAAFATYLARIRGTGCFDIGFKDVELQRELIGLEGFFASIVPCRVDVDYEQSFEEAFKAVNAQVELTSLHKTYAHDVVARYPALRSLPELSHESIFPVVVERVEKLEDHQAGSGNELTLVIPSEGKECCWLYNTEALNGDSIARMLEQFTTFLHSIVTDPKERVAYLPLLSEPERRKILVEWNDTQADYPKDKCIHQLFEAQVERTPDAVAVQSDLQQLTYRELNQRANQLAHYLRMLGVGPEAIIGLYMERSLEMIVGLLGILKAGGAYLPLDPTYSKERLTFMLEDAKVPMLLAQARLIEELPPGIHVICLDTGWEAITQESQENPVNEAVAENLAYVIYTSGSTGKPKGVMIQHRSLVNYVESASIKFRIEKSDQILQFASISFDSSAGQIYPCLTRGATLVLRTDSMLDTVSVFLQKCQDWNITVLGLPTAYWHELTARLSSQTKALPPSLRLVVIGGEKALPERLITWHHQVGQHVRLVNAYGPTEATIVSTRCELVGDDQTELDIHKLPIGRPICNAQTYVLDQYLQPVPIGVPGELHIGGAGLARGYLNRPDLTALKFIPNPYCSEPGTRLYKTGDLVRYLPSGNIEFLGRIDDQVKVRGFRIELGEIEAVLAQHPTVREAVVTVRKDISGNKSLVAYIVPHQEQAFTIDELRHFLKQKLPDYMVPGAFVLLAALPLTPNGKVDRRALPAPDQIRKESEETFVAPRNELEIQLTKIWEKVLVVHPISVKDNFFDLGGHSMLAAHLVAQIEQKLSRNLPLANLFQAPTIEELASILSQEGYSSEHKKPILKLESATNLLNQSGSLSLCSSLIAIQPSGSKPPLFCIHVLGRGLKFYRPLAHHLGLEQPLYGLAAQIMDKKYALPNRVEDLAAHYIKEMRILQPEGPYFLAGISFGGSVAFEMAQQLVAQGQKVALLALLDTYSLKAVNQRPIGERLAVHWSNFLELGPIYVLKKAMENVKGKVQRFNSKLNHSLKVISRKFCLSIGRPLPDNLQDFTFQQENTQAWRNYVPQVYPGQVTLFRSRDQMTDIKSYTDPQLGWGELAAGGLEVHGVPGTHLGMLQEPHVQVLAEKLGTVLDLKRQQGG